MRKTQFANEERYHICNRGVDKRDIFMDRSDYERFLICMDLVNDTRIGVTEDWRNFIKSNPGAKLSDFRELSSGKAGKDIERLVKYNFFCLNPNHYHLTLEQLMEKGVEKFMHKLSTSYTNYFNTKYNRSGSLFQGPFKSVHINTNEYFLYLSAYVNKNHLIHGYKEGDDWPYSSLFDYLGKRGGTFCDTSPVMDQFSGIKEYEDFIKSNALYMKEKKETEKYLLE